MKHKIAEKPLYKIDLPVGQEIPEEFPLSKLMTDTKKYPGDEKIGSSGKLSNFDTRISTQLSKIVSSISTKEII